MTDSAGLKRVGIGIIDTDKSKADIVPLAIWEREVPARRTKVSTQRSIRPTSEHLVCTQEGIRPQPHFGSSCTNLHTTISVTVEVMDTPSIRALAPRS